MHEMLAESLGNQVIAQSVGPLVTVLLGGFVLGFITRQFQIESRPEAQRKHGPRRRTYRRTLL